MKKIFILLLILCSFSLFSCQGNEFTDDVPISERRAYDGTLRDDTFYFVTLTEEESKKNKEYDVSDFDLKNLYSVETFLKADNYDDLWKKDYYRVELRFLFKNLSYEIAEENESKMWKDKRIDIVSANMEYSLYDDTTGGFINFLETNLDINKIYFLSDSSEKEATSAIVNDKDEFDSVKNNYRYNKIGGYGCISLSENELLNSYDEDFFVNNSLIFLKIDIPYLKAGYILKSIYSDNDHINIMYNSYTHFYREPSNKSYFYLIEISEKLEGKDIVINANDLYYYV